MRNKALIIDDNKGDIELLKVYFLEHGLHYEVFWAANGEEGLQIASEQHPDIVFLDINLPGLDGYAVCEVLRATATKPLHIIMMTGSKDPNARKLAEEYGADGFCTKQVKDIMETSMKYLRNRK